MNNTWYDSDPGTPTGTTYYQIVNRWQSNTYLYDAGNGQVKYGTNPGTDYKYQWAQVDAGSGYIQLRNRSTGNYMHVENQTGYVQCGTITPSWYSSMWTIAATGDGWNYIRNRWQSSEWIHLENLLGYAQYSGPQTGWYSAMWQFVNPTTGLAATRMPYAMDTEAAADSKKQVRIYPNLSANNRFFVEIKGFATAKPVQISVHDISGKLMLVQRLDGSGFVQHHLPAGIYFVSIRSEQLDIIKKIIVQ
jgi:hypothetical protein